jgi:protein-tyrosine phosphatase
MPEVLAWHPHAALGPALRLLRAGRLVGLPTESGYCLAADGLCPAAVEQLQTAGEGSVTVAVSGLAQARDWAPQLQAPGSRLAKRLWPGPLNLAVPEAREHGVASRLPPNVWERLASDGLLHLRAPAHAAVMEILHRRAGPLLLAAVPGANAAEVAQALGERVELIIDGGPTSSAPAPTVVRVDGTSWRVLHPGAVSEEQLRLQASCLVVFVCTGNTCRSPLAEALFKKRLADRLGCGVDELPGRGFLVLSAGLAAMMGGPAAAEAVEVAGSFGADLSGHHSQPLTADLAAQADYLMAMTRGHVRTLLAHYPQLGARPRLLDPAGTDLADPLGGDRPVYEECGRHIWQHLGALVDEIQPPEKGQVQP